MEITKETELYTPSGERFISIGGLYLHDFIGETIEKLREGGHDFFVYVKPTGYDYNINKVDGAFIFSEFTCTQGLVSLTPEEIQAIETAKLFFTT